MPSDVIGRPFEAGNPGRPVGALNKVNRELKAMIMEALEGVGGVTYLMERARDPDSANAFLSLVGKVLPLQVTGKDGAPLDVPHAVVFVVGDRAAAAQMLEAPSVKVLARGPSPSDAEAGDAE